MLVFSLPISAAQAQGTPTPDAPRQAAIGELDCRTLLRLGGEERDFTILYLHGFVSGRTNQQLLPVKDLAEATDRLIDRCIDKPADKALGVLEQVRAVRQ
ncbi:MAG: hypothetical protein KBF65_12020 [Rubrivivax sp.]|nr:hypothetical protein [Rubrivivax sp.]